MKTKITIVKVGYIDHILNSEKIRRWKSKLFEIVDIQTIEYLSDSEINDGYLDQKFSKESLSKVFSHSKNSDFTVAITSCRFDDNFYVHQINENRVGISLYGITEILKTENISIENFIIKQLYAVCALSLIANISDDNEVYDIVHLDTRGCLFDMNGNREDILYNTEKPIICESCKDKFKKKQIAQGTISNLNKELKRIQKPIILKLERYIKKYPLVAMIIGAIIAICISQIFELVWQIIKSLI